MRDERYSSNSLRFKEHLFASYFCDAFPQVRQFSAPFWVYNCEERKLCPQWGTSLPCTQMQRPSALSSESGRLSPGSGHSQSSPPLPVLILGEGGSGAGILSRLIGEAKGYLVWREPRNWRFTGHMTDAVLTSLLANLFRCALSPQQLLMLHSQLPTGAQPVLEEVPESALIDGEIAVNGLEQRYYGEFTANVEPRFCGSGTATGAIVTRYQQGLPADLNNLPVRVLLVVRHPVDIVVARLNAMRVRSGPAWSECTLSSIERCAGVLCNSMEQMLRSLDSRISTQNDLLRIVRWESFNRRKQPVAADLLAWLGVEVNRTTLLTMLLQVEEEMREFNLMSEKKPISPRSRYIVEQTCSNVISRLGYRTSVITVSKPKHGRGKRYVQRTWGRDTGMPEKVKNAQHFERFASPHILLEHVHASGPRFFLCPVRLSGAEVIMRFFLRRDSPLATVSPLCFPQSLADHCPQRHGPKWHRSRWGPYPFDALDAKAVKIVPNSTAPRIAVVRNPWDRLVSAFNRFIAQGDKSTALHRSWIREFFGLYDNEKITFSHFVRWVAQQESGVMHRAWQPMMETCRFGTAFHYSAIIRLESLEEDIKRVTSLLRLTSEDQSLFQQVIAKSRPVHQIGGFDRQLRMLHYYLSDDSHDLVQIVKQRYQHDIDFFGYSFPTNETLTFTRST